MSKRILIITTSLRSNSNSDALAHAFAKGAVESGNTVERILRFAEDVLPVSSSDDVSFKTMPFRLPSR